MTLLEQFTSLNRTHEAVYEAVVELEKAWGHGARVRDLAEMLDFPEVTVRKYLEELEVVGLVIWEPVRVVAWFERGVPVLGAVG